LEGDTIPDRNLQNGDCEIEVQTFDSEDCLCGQLKKHPQSDSLFARIDSDDIAKKNIDDPKMRSNGGNHPSGESRNDGKHHASDS
jgi:hypothetical protein